MKDFAPLFYRAGQKLLNFSRRRAGEAHFAYSTAIWAATRALFRARETFDLKLSPPVSSLTFASRKGVMSLPCTPAASAAARAVPLTPYIYPKSRPSSSEIGFAISTPPSRPSAHFAFRMAAISAASFAA